MLDRLTDLLGVSLGCSVAIILLLALTPTLSKHFSPRLRYWTWALLAVRLLLPGMPWGRNTIPAAIQVQPPQTITAPAYDGMAQDIEAASPYGYTAYMFSNTPYHVWYSDDQNNSIRAYDNPFFRLEAYNNDWSLSFHLDGIWTAGVLLGLFWQIVSYLAFLRRIKRLALPANPSDLAALKSQKQSLGISRTVSLVRSEIISSPLLMGFLKPIIVLPAQLPEHTLAPSLVHELTHLKRGDLWYQLLMRLCQCVHWFNPLVWLMVRQAKRDMELCCDYDLLQSQGEEARRAYGQAILDQMTAGQSTSSLTTGFSGDKQSIFTRFKAIMDTSPKKKGTFALVLSLCAVALAGGLIVFQNGTKNEPVQNGDTLRITLDGDAYQSISANYYEEGFDWSYSSLPTLVSYEDSDAVLLSLPEGLDPTELQISEDHYCSDNVYEPDRKNMIERRDPVPTYLADKHAISLPVSRTNPGAEEESVFFLTWGENSKFRYVFRLEFASPAPELTLTDTFDRYSSDSFSVSATERDGLPYYKFENAAFGISILMPEQCQTNPSIISYRGKTITALLPCNPLAGCKYGNVGGQARFTTADLTGDGKEELVYIWGYGGTGVWEDQCKIFDLTTMEEIPVLLPWDEEMLSEYVQAELLSYEDSNSALFRITTADDIVAYSFLTAQNTEQPLGPVQLRFDGHTHIGLEENQLNLTLAFSPDNVRTFMYALSYLGDVTGRLTYSPSLRGFSLSPPFSAEVYNPIEYQP